MHIVASPDIHIAELGQEFVPEIVNPPVSVFNNAERLLTVTGRFEKPDGYQHALEDNIGIIAHAVGAVIQESPYYKRAKVYGVGEHIRRTTVYGISEFGTLNDRDDLFQEGVCAFLKHRGDYDASLASFSTFIMPKILNSFSMNLPHMAPGVKYPQNAFSLNLASLEFVDAVKMPDYDGYGYDDDYTHLERWLPLEEVGTMPRYDVLGEPSDETNEDVNNDNYHYALGSLTSRERTILMQYYTAKEDGTVATLREIGQEFNLSYERIRQIISSAIEKVRKEYALLQKARIDREIATNLLKTTSNSKLAGLKTQNPLKDITTPEQRALINRAKLNGLAQAKLATGRMTVNGTGVVVPIED